MAASVNEKRRGAAEREPQGRALASVLEARLAHLKGTTARAAAALDDGDGPDGAAELAAAAAQQEVARRALARVD